MIAMCYQYTITIDAEICDIVDRSFPPLHRIVQWCGFVMIFLCNKLIAYVKKQTHILIMSCST